MTIIYVSPQGDSMTADLLAGTHSDGDVLNQKIFTLKDGYVAIAGNAFHVPSMFLDEDVELNTLIEAIKRPGYLLRESAQIQLVFMPHDPDTSVPCQAFMLQLDAINDEVINTSTDKAHYYVYDQFDVPPHGITGAARVFGNPSLINLAPNGDYVNARKALHLFTLYHEIMGIGAKPQQVFRG